MYAIELINFIKSQNLTSHDLPILVNGEPIVKIELIKDEKCGYAFNIETY